ncbi:recombination protein RecO [Helicobacter sp. MIT 14-3879]|uniref:recombination protein RecO n=1 Tax=Helicobacter sp. MIT 14-3879 TaxID=2040649 RepID=UPI000E1E7DFE|nr:recombination protein RecO [Helicobacter sp. MIT 14-3879]RDU64085.1 recombination protein RecO [Helicobacter sp. MIT 14-3879]
MKGYISNIIKLKNEDIIVKIITKNKFLSLYRFYGIRHSIINIGRKIDFEIDYSGVFMPRLRSIAQLSFEWERDYNKLYYFQTFIKTLNKHLQDTQDIPSFYFELLNEATIKINKQAPNRVLINLYSKLLENEGRKILHKKCFICNNPLGGEILIARGFLGAHKNCIISECLLDRDKFFDFLKNNKSIFLNDIEVESLFNIMIEGL